MVPLQFLPLTCINTFSDDNRTYVYVEERWNSIALILHLEPESPPYTVQFRSEVSIRSQVHVSCLKPYLFCSGVAPLADDAQSNDSYTP